MPTRLGNGEGRADREATDTHRIRSPGVRSTAGREGGLGNWGRPGTGGGSRLPRCLPGRRAVRGTERAGRPMQPSHAGRGKGPPCGGVWEEGEDRGWALSLETPSKLRLFQRKLYGKAQEEPPCRFSRLDDKIYREDILASAYERAKSTRRAPGVDGQSFEEIESRGLEKGRIGSRNDRRAKTYQPPPGRRVRMPKPGGGERPLRMPTMRERGVQTAAQRVWEPIFEADWEPEADGYGPKRARRPRASPPAALRRLPRGGRR